MSEGGGPKCKFPSWATSHHWHSLDGKISVKSYHKNSTLHIADTSPQEGGSSGGYHYSPGGRGSGSGTNNGMGGVIYGGFEGLPPSGSNLFSGGTRITCQSSRELGEDHVAVVAQHTEGW